MTAAEVLQSLAARIRALTPTEQTDETDRFGVIVGTRGPANVGRVVVVSGTLPRRRFRTARTCSDWEFTVTIDTVYLATPEQDDESPAYMRALNDAEAILADLYDWAATTDGVLSFEPQNGIVADNDDHLVATMQADISYTRG